MRLRWLSLALGWGGGAGGEGCSRQNQAFPLKKTTLSEKDVFQGASAGPFPDLSRQGTSQNPHFLQLIGGVAWRKGPKGVSFRRSEKHPCSGCVLFPKENLGIFVDLSLLGSHT